jgi:twitching motility protein PilT
MANPADVLFGKIAIKNRLVDERRIKECLAVLSKRGEGSLGQVLVEKGYLTPAQYRAIQAHVQKLSPNGQGRATAKAPEHAAASKTEEPPVEELVTVGDNVKPLTAREDVHESVRVRDLAARDYSHLEGKPLDVYLQEARKVGASDLHFQVDAPPFMRLHGEIVYLKHAALTPEYTEPRIYEILADRERKIFNTHHDLDFCYEQPHGRYRANVCKQRKGIDAVFRIIPIKVPTLEELNLPPVLRRFTEYRHGLVLLTGPAGSGKTATMAALIDIVNQRQQDHIVIVEEPIEYVIESKRCNVTQRHVRVHTNSFIAALRSALRADPDYICVGEMRDLETVSMAITAAETGHLVFATLHTTNSMRSIDRIIDVFPPKEQDQIRSMVSESMRGVISQQLLPRADGLGRVPALEIMFATPAVCNLIRERKTFQLPSVLQTGTRQGMITMDDSIGNLVKKKLVTKETAAFYAESPQRFQ